MSRRPPSTPPGPAGRRIRRRGIEAFGAALVASGLLASACAPRAPSHTGLHLIGDTLVHSRAPPTSAYAAYLRCRLALEAAPPRLDEAAAHIEVAIAADPRDPQLWTVRGEIAARRGDGDAAIASVRRALSLAPDFPAAKQLEARLDRGDAVAGNGSAARVP